MASRERWGDYHIPSRAVEARSVSRWAQRNTEGEGGKAVAVSYTDKSGRTHTGVRVWNTETGESRTWRIRVNDYDRVKEYLRGRFGDAQVLES